MDTRVKIVDEAGALAAAERGATVVSGHFDPLTADMAERLAALKKPGAPLLVLIETHSHAILPQRARAELVAALAAVDFACEGSANIKPEIRLEDEHSTLLRQLIRRAHARQQAAATSAADGAGKR